MHGQQNIKIRYDYSERVISPTQRPLHDNTRQSQETYKFPGGFRTGNPGKGAVANPRLTPRGHRDGMK